MMKVDVNRGNMSQYVPITLDSLNNWDIELWLAFQVGNDNHPYYVNLCIPTYNINKIHFGDLRDNPKIMSLAPYYPSP